MTQWVEGEPDMSDEGDVTLSAAAFATLVERTGPLVVRMLDYDGELRSGRLSVRRGVFTFTHRWTGEVFAQGPLDGLGLIVEVIETRQDRTKAHREWKQKSASG